MSIHRRRNRPTERDLAALADGSLSPARRARVERAVAASPQLQAQVREQRNALGAVRAASDVRAPAALRMRVAQTQPARPLRRWTPVLAAGGTAAAAAAAVLLAVGGGHGHQPTVAEVAALGARPALATASGARHGPTTLERPVAAGLRFPYWQGRFGWKATGVRHDRVAGRATTTVFYSRRSEVVAYTIVGGSALPAADATAFHGRRAVTWLRRGHTCVLSGARTPRATLLRLAAWRGGGDIAF